MAEIVVSAPLCFDRPFHKVQLSLRIHGHDASQLDIFSLLPSGFLFDSDVGA